MRVSDVLGSSVIVQPTWRSFDEAIAGLVEQLTASGRLPKHLARTAIAHIREREAVASTAMVDIGVSIPHARVEGINGIMAAVAVSAGAVYQVVDGLPISIVALVLSSPKLTGEHLTFLSALSILLQSGRVRQQLCSATTADEVVQLLRANEQGR